MDVCTPEISIQKKNLQRNDCLFLHPKNIVADFWKFFETIEDDVIDDVIAIVLGPETGDPN